MDLISHNGLIPAGHRRLIFAGVNLVLVVLGALPLTWRFSQHGWTLPHVVLFALFVLLLAQIVYGFTLAVTGWWLLRRGRDRPRINETLPPDAVSGGLPAVAVVMPIFNEDVGRVFQGLRVMYESLQQTGQGEVFDFFVLSDSSDPNLWIAEEQAWFELCKRVRGFGHIFYRKRRVALHYKSGNIADFCRRWGSRYRYLIVLDADSVMTGRALVRLAALMERNPGVGIIQTSPRLVLGRSLFQRINQFANHVYGPMFAAGANAWQLDNANFWGHNAIVRVKPFMKYCAMPELPKTSPLGTRILSHDTVEAAFMRRAGYEVWCAYDMEETYEETPPHLLASLQRERRWCHGNLQHLWLLFAPGLTTASRINIAIGILAYVSAPLWLLFVVLNTVSLGGGPAAAGNATTGIEDDMLFVGVMGLLLLPKALGVLLLIRSPEERRACGGRAKILSGVLGEAIFSMLLAPILMLFYTRFVWSSLTDAVVRWGRQQRTDQDGPAWHEWLALHGGHTVIALVCAGGAAWLAPSSLPWLAPILAGPLLAIPFSRLTASNSLGQQTRQHGWFVVPAECQPPIELQQFDETLAGAAGGVFQTQDYAPDYGLLQAVLDPYVNSIHVTLLRQRSQTSVRTHACLTALCDRLLLDGPFALTRLEKRMLLGNADAMLAAHQKLWSIPASHLHDWWQAAFRRYNENSALDLRRSVSSL